MHKETFTTTEDDKLSVNHISTNMFS